MDPQGIIQENLEKYLIRGKQYVAELPPELARWYCYTSDGGHSICCVLKQHAAPGVNLAEFIIPVPVRTVLRGYTERDGFVLVDLPYTSERGLVTPRDDDEY